jgi:drug/metabolite transporter (DMT)-like permease
MAGWLTMMLCMAVFGREVTRTINVFQVMELRSLLGLVMILPLVYAAGGFRAMKTQYPMRHVGRNVVHYGAQYAWFFALNLITLAQVIAIEFTMPIWTAILAVLFLGEQMNRWKVASIALGLVGVWVIVRPATGHIDTGQMWALAAAVGFGVSVAMVKALTRTEGVVRIVFWMMVIQSIMGIIPAWTVWQPMPVELWPYMLGVGVCGTFSHYCMARAMLYADATVVIPMDFLRVPLTAIVGWLLYAEVIDVYTAAGAALILAGNVLNLTRAGTARV